MRRPLAAAVTLAYPGHRFRVDREGRWMNIQARATFVSPTLHTSSYDHVASWVRDNWAWDYQLVPGDVVVDVGSGIGQETVVFSNWVAPSGRVVSIEAEPATFSALRATVEQSGCENVELIECAIMDADGEISIGIGQHHVANSVLYGGGEPVPARSLQSLLDQLGVDKVDFIKMNIEGAEVNALEGMGPWLGRCRAACISCHDFVADLGGGDSFRTKARVREMLERAGYVVRTRPDHPDIWVRDYLYAHLPGSAGQG
jgi:FkbM family methyltransferase